MLKLLLDENFNNDVYRALLKRDPTLDIVRVQDVGLSSIDDPTILAQAAQENRVLITHDVQTMTYYAYERVRNGLPMPGVFEVSHELAIGTVIEDLYTLILLSQPNEWEGQVRYLPLR